MILVLDGPPGVGKSKLAEALAEGIYQSEIPATHPLHPCASTS